MSLRYRLALVLAALAGCAAVATIVVADTTARDRLIRSVDDALVMRTAAATAWLDKFPEGKPPAMPTGTSTQDSPLHYDTEIYVLDGNGAVISRPGEVVLPVDASDRRLARDGGSPQIRDVRINGVDYRMRTTPLSSGGALQVAQQINETNRVLSSLRTRFGLIGISVVAAAILLGWLVARRITRPIEQLAFAAEHVTSTGDLSTAVTTQRKDETGRLARSFSTMLTALSRSREQQHHLIQDAGHELRTPLTSVRTNVELLERYPDLSPNERAEVFSDLRTELHEISSLVDELVVLAGDERDASPPPVIDLEDVVTRTVARVSRRHDRAIALRGSGATVAAWPASIERAVGNLIDNAVKFSPEGRPVDVMIRGTEVAVRDRGVGLDPVDTPRIFDRFYRAPSARSLAGSGLGLAMVRQIIDTSGGSVFARNHTDGGAVVGFTLPPASPSSD